MGDARRFSRRRGVCHAAGSFLVSCAFLTRAALVAAAPLGRGEPTTASKESVSRLAFGSCNKQYLPQPMWSTIEDLSPDVWLWIGDAVYVDKKSDGGVEKMKEAFAHQLANQDYQRFLSKVPTVEGVWDDHDYGVNDAGKDLSDHPGRVAAFLDFLGVGPEDPRRGGATLYSSHVFGEAPKQVKVLMLDIRTQRDGYHAFNIAHRKFKFAAMIGAMFRWFSGSFCLGSDYDGSIIAEDQWQWLEGQLADSEASVHVLVSTLQVLTSNPLVESWGHFPRSRERLLSLLHRTNPAGMVILSGDVHHAELASGWQASPSPPEEASSLPPGHPPLRDEGAASTGGGCPFSRRNKQTVGSESDAGTSDVAGGECAAHSGVGGSLEGQGRGVVEVTTSGMTHSCLSTHGKRMCEAYLDRWQEHRWRDDAYFLDANFGDMEIKWAEDENAPQPAKMTVTVRDMNGTAILPVIEHRGQLESGDVGVHPGTFTPEEEIEVETAGSGHGDRPGRTSLEPEITFLDRCPPPECVEDVLPAGCTARRVSQLAGSIIALVVSCFIFARGARKLTGGRKTEKVGQRSAPSVIGSVMRGTANGARNGIRNGDRNGDRNGALNETRNGS